MCIRDRDTDSIGMVRENGMTMEQFAELFRRMQAAPAPATSEKMCIRDRDKITEWLKEMLIGGIVSNLSGMFDATNQKVAEISGCLLYTSRCV